MRGNFFEQCFFFHICKY